MACLDDPAEYSPGKLRFNTIALSLCSGDYLARFCLLDALVLGAVLLQLLLQTTGQV